MKKLYLGLLGTAILATGIFTLNRVISDNNPNIREKQETVDTRIDNNKYWIKQAEKGLGTLNPDTEVPEAIYTGSKIKAFSVVNDNSPDVPVTEDPSTQSENSIFVNPNNNENPFNSNNSTNEAVSALYGANYLYSFDTGETWEGEVTGAGGNNSGDPAAAIGLNGRYFTQFITSNYGQGISWSDDNGQTWESTVISGVNGASVLDKNHMWIDNSPSSPYEGNLYAAWVPLGGSPQNENEIEIAYSSENGESWSSPINISSAVNAGSHNQGVNIQTGPNGEVYAVWAIYDSWPSDETAIGFARSYDGGATWEPATRIIENIRGIRTTETSKNMRVNSFPVMAVDISGGQYDGNIYVTWSNIGVPGVNTGSDIDVYIIRSTNDGDDWSDPIRVNTDEPGQGNEHYLPWITVDPETGIISAVFYDDREVGGTMCEAWAANSYDGGDTWEDFKVSDVAFTPTPIPGLAGGYFGDYLAIAARGGIVYPCWTDNRDSYAMTYVSPYITNALTRPEDLQLDLTFESGEVELNWTWEGAVDFDYFNVYRDDELIGTTTDTFYLNTLPDYGVYGYDVTAVYVNGDESFPASNSIQWGDAHINVNPESVYVTMLPDDTTSRDVIITNTGELDLNYSLTAFILTDSRDINSYCDAYASICDEYIANVEVGTISNSTGCDNYADYTDMETDMYVGDNYPMTVTNGNTSYPGDECGIWIDWNQDEDFDDEDEAIQVNGSPGVGPYTANISPPLHALSGTTRMRIRITWNESPQPCGTSQYGEVEDYSINVVSWLSLNPKQGNIMPSSTDTIGVNFFSTGMEVGLYEAEMHIFSNDPDLATVVVPLTMEITDVFAEVTADADQLCEGQDVQLYSEVHNGSGTYEYTWTSIPEGYTSNEQNPYFENLTETTVFKLQVNDGVQDIFGEKEIIVHELPEVDLGPETQICEGDSHMLSVESGYASYLWQDGSTESYYEVRETGTYYVEVANAFGCTTTDTVDIMVYDYPNVNLGTDTLICAHLGYVLDAGDSGMDYLWFNGENTQMITVDTNTLNVGLGNLNVFVDVANGSCTTSDTVVVSFQDCTGIDELNSLRISNIYPNPTNGIVNIDFFAATPAEIALKVVNSEGKVVYLNASLDIYNNHRERIDLSGQAAGIYSLHIINGKESVIRKIILN